jgi:glutamate 5-kinase
MEMDKSGKKKLLLKIGTSTLTKGTQSISRGKIEDIARQIALLKDQYDFIIVSSGAIAVAKQFVEIEGKGKEIKVKQALAAIGQPHLMRIIQESFRELKLLTAQCLLSYMDFERKETKQNIVNTINTLVDNGYIPIINENDTVSTEEIKFGDNDILAALTAELIEVDLLILATNTYGFYQNGQTLKTIHNINDVAKFIEDKKSNQGTGGMVSKLRAAQIAQKAGIETWLVNGWEDNFIKKALANELPFTKVLPQQ